MGRALVVDSRAQSLELLQRLGFTCAESDDPYAAMHELCRRPLAYRALILSLQTAYREELALVGAIKRRFGHIEIWLTQTDGRQAALAEAMRQGADGLLDGEGLHRAAVADGMPDDPVPQALAASSPVIHADAPEDTAHDEFAIGEPILTAEELRALLTEQPVAGDNDERN